MKLDETELLKKYLNDNDFLKSELRKNCGTQNITHFQHRSPPDPLVKYTQNDVVESGFQLWAYFSPTLEFKLQETICEKWNYCQKKNQYNNRLNLASALLTYLYTTSVVNEVVKVMPVVLAVAYVLQSDCLDKHCKC